MEAFSEEDDAPRFDVAFDESLYSVFKMVGEALWNNFEAIDETEKQVKKAAKSPNLVRDLSRVQRKSWIQMSCSYEQAKIIWWIGDSCSHYFIHLFTR